MGYLYPDLRPKLQRLIPLLSSDHAGEVAATAAAIGRVLLGAGLDWHDLADVVGIGPEPVATGPGLIVRWHPDRRFTVARVLKVSISNGSFTEWEVGFAASIIDLIGQGASTLSDKQVGVLNRLLAKAAGGRA